MRSSRKYHLEIVRRFSETLQEGHGRLQEARRETPCTRAPAAKLRTTRLCLKKQQETLDPILKDRG